MEDGNSLEGGPRPEEFRDNTRRQTRQLAPEEAAQIDDIKRLGNELIAAIDRPSPDGVPRGGRERALARTNVEQAVMWAVKGVTAL